MNTIGKLLIFSGILLILLGIIFSFADKLPFLGRLPGDIYLKKDNFTFYFPLATSILISIVFSIILWLIKRFYR